ncbi:MAG: hypothetical protein ACYC3W_00420 [Candidatus Nanopelagicales bacterium]
MGRSERIVIIQALREALGLMRREDEDLIFQTFGIGSRPTSGWGEIPSITAWLSEYASDEQLLEVADHLRLPYDQVPVSVGSTEQATTLQLFASHLSLHRSLVGQVAALLSAMRIDLFVAHDSIPMDAAWEADIAKSLGTCHGAVAFIHEGFHNSHYCMQEIGWLLGRGIPVARLLLGDTPRGLLAALQGRSLVDRPPDEVATAIMEWCGQQQAFSHAYTESLSLALEESPGFKRTDRVWAHLKSVSNPSADQLERILRAAESNDQVYGTGVGGYAGPPYRSVIAQRVEEWDASGVFAARIAALRSAPPGQPI